MKDDLIGRIVMIKLGGHKGIFGKIISKSIYGHYYKISFVDKNGKAIKKMYSITSFKLISGR